MMRFFRAIRMFLGNLGLPKAVNWSQEDAANLRDFLRTSTGAKLRHVMVSRCAAMNEWAAETATPPGCGMATGNRQMMTLILSCADTSNGEPTEETAPNDAADSLEHLAP
jgi:hypothetical protein